MITQLHLHKNYIALMSQRHLNSVWHVPKISADTYLAIIRDGNRDAGHLAVVISAVAYSFFLWCRLSGGLSAWRAWKSVLRQVKRVMESAPRCIFIHSRAHKIELYSDRYTAKSIERKNEDIVRLFLYISLFLI